MKFYIDQRCYDNLKEAGNHDALAVILQRSQGFFCGYQVNIEAKKITKLSIEDGQAISDDKPENMLNSSAKPRVGDTVHLKLKVASIEDNGTAYWVKRYDTGISHRVDVSELELVKRNEDPTTQEVTATPEQWEEINKIVKG